MSALDRVIKDDTTYEIVPEIAPLFDSTVSYSAGDCVIKDAVLYRFTAAHAAGDWTGTDAEKIEVGEELTNLKDALSESEAMQKLLCDEIPDTTQTYTFTDGSVSQVVHTDSNDVAVRTDAYTYGDDEIIEVRTLSTGQSLTIATDLTTLETVVTYAAA